MAECESLQGSWGQTCPDCGQPLPVKLPLDHGRPCARTSLDRGHGWDGSPLPKHTTAEVKRWSTKGEYRATPEHREHLAEATRAYYARRRGEA